MLHLNSHKSQVHQNNLDLISNKCSEETTDALSRASRLQKGHVGLHIPRYDNHHKNHNASSRANPLTARGAAFPDDLCAR